MSNAADHGLEDLRARTERRRAILRQLVAGALAALAVDAAGFVLFGRDAGAAMPLTAVSATTDATAAITAAIAVAAPTTNESATTATAMTATTTTATPTNTTTTTTRATPIMDRPVARIAVGDMHVRRQRGEPATEQAMLVAPNGDTATAAPTIEPPAPSQPSRPSAEDPISTGFAPNAACACKAGDPLCSCF